MERFLQYSLAHGRAIRIIYQDEGGKLRQCNAQVTALTEDTVTFQSLRPRGEHTLKLTSILSADYRRGDEGQ